MKWDERSTRVWLFLVPPAGEADAFVMQNRYPAGYGSAAGKAVWILLLEAASGVSGQPDDTAAAVASWAFLHGYATLEDSGAFGPSGPKGGLERGVEVILRPE